MQVTMHVDIGIPMTNHLIFIVFLTIIKNLKYFENFEVCLSSEITLRKNYLQYEVRVKTVLQGKISPKIAQNVGNFYSICIIQSVLIIYYNIFLRRFYLTGAFLRHYNRIITHNLPWRSTPVKIPSV